MSELPFDENVSFDKMVSQEASYDLSIPAKFFPRLAEACVDIVSPVKACFRFYLDLQGLRTIEGKIGTEIKVECQRCGEPFVLKISSSFKSTCDAEKAKLLRIDDKQDLVELNADGSFALLAFLEDCLLLEVPFVPMHDKASGECSVSNELRVFGENETKSDNPFAALSALKDKLKMQ